MRDPESLEAAIACARAALDRKAYDLVVLDVRELTSLADFFVICTGRSDTQVQAIAEHVEIERKHAGHPPLGVEGFRKGQWVIVDFGDIVLHVFNEPTREFYDLERLWAKAPVVELPEDCAVQVRDLQLAATR